MPVRTKQTFVGWPANAYLEYFSGALPHGVLLERFVSGALPHGALLERFVSGALPHGALLERLCFRSVWLELFWN